MLSTWLFIALSAQPACISAALPAYPASEVRSGVPDAGRSTTLYVPDDHATIQGAIDAALNGDQVIVRAGTYIENLDFLGKAIAVRSESGPALTVIDGGGTDRVVQFQSGETPATVLSGFTITHGNAATGNGGGIDATLRSSPTITDCIIVDNHAYGLGGGIACRGFSNATILRCTFLRNTCRGAAEGAQGGGLSCFFSNVTVRDCVFIENESERGGAIDCSGSLSEITNCVFVGNRADFSGGAVFCSVADPRITNCSFSENVAKTGGALVTAGAVLPSHPRLTNCILWNDLPDEIVVGIGTVTVSFSDVMGGWPGTGNFDVEPGYAGLDRTDLHLTWSSPCRDAGDNGAVWVAEDFEGDRRLAGGRVDIGADEFWPHLYFSGDAVPGGSIRVAVVGSPGSPVLLGLGSGVQLPPRATSYGDLYLALPLLRELTLPAVPGTGVLVHPATVPAAWSVGSQYPFQALVGPLGGATTRLTNLRLLTVE